MQKDGRNKRGRESDKILSETIEEYPGLSQYELGRKLGWPSGHVDGSTRRLLRQRAIFIRIVERNGRRLNLVYPKDQKPPNLLEVPTNLLRIGNPLWDQRAFIYALDSSTIGIAGKEMPEWKAISCFQENIPIQKREGKISLEIPGKFSRFYSLERKHRAVSVNGNNILVTIDGDIIEEKRYPS